MQPRILNSRVLRFLSLTAFLFAFGLIVSGCGEEQSKTGQLTPKNEAAEQSTNDMKNFMDKQQQKK